VVQQYALENNVRFLGLSEVSTNILAGSWALMGADLNQLKRSRW